MMDPEIVRTRTTHGWAFTDLSPEHMNRVQAYLADGDPRHLDGTKYVQLRRGVLERMMPSERRRHGLPPAPEKEAAAPAPDSVTLPLLPGMTLHTVRSDEAKLIIVIDKDDKLTIGGTLSDTEAIKHVHALMHAMIAAAKTRRNGGN